MTIPSTTRFTALVLWLISWACILHAASLSKAINLITRAIPKGINWGIFMWVIVYISIMRWILLRFTQSFHLNSTHQSEFDNIKVNSIMISSDWDIFVYSHLEWKILKNQLILLKIKWYRTWKLWCISNTTTKMENIMILLSTIFVNKPVNNYFMSRKGKAYFECFKKMLKHSQF